LYSLDYERHHHRPEKKEEKKGSEERKKRNFSMEKKEARTKTRTLPALTFEYFVSV
jgi:hypothetical protein